MIELLHFEVRWSPLGIMLSTIRTMNLPHISRLSETLHERWRREEQTLGFGDEILIAPFGMVCFRDSQSQALQHSGDIDGYDHSSRAALVGLLRGMGISLPSDIDWVLLRAVNPALPSESPTSSGSTVRFLWPASLCFHRHRPVNGGNQIGVLHDIARGEFASPLAKAEAWFLGKSAREEAIKLKIKEDAETEAQKPRKPMSDAENEDEDQFANSIARTNQYISAQDASIVYPTPPDAIMSQPQGASMVQDFQAVASVGGHQESHTEDLETANAKSPTFDSSGMPLPSASYEKGDDEDLFGEIDTDMFAANDLTEADFNFFDEPDLEPVYVKDDLLEDGFDTKRAIAQIPQDDDGDRDNEVASADNEVAIELPLVDSPGPSSLTQK